MRYKELNTLTLEGFEGPIDFLLYLVQKKEIDIYEISLHDITEQYLHRLEEMTYNLDTGAEFVGTTATLLWLKSKMLLPQQEEEPSEHLDEDPYVSIIQHLIDYCHFKQVAKDFAEREKQQSLQHTRGTVPFDNMEKKLGIEHITLDDLSELFKHVLDKIPAQCQLHKERWHVTDKMNDLKQRLRDAPMIVLEDVLIQNSCRQELIVTFLAVLELMKLNQICIMKDKQTSQILVQGV